MPTSPQLLPTEFLGEQAATTASPRTSGGKIFVAAVVILLLSTGVWFRIENLNSVPGLNGDEAWSGVQAVKFLRGEPIAWRTPTGNPLNLFFWGPLVALHAAFAPSIALLRSVSVASGLLAIAANYWLCRRVFDRATAVVSTVLLAVLPVMIAYSRFAWDASQTPLVSVFVVYAALGVGRIFNPSRCPTARGRTGNLSYVALAIALAVAIWVHPTNLFLAPLVVACLAPWEKLRAARPQLGMVICLAVAVVFVVRSPGDLLRFTVDLERLFSGSTVYRFISGAVRGDGFDWSDAVMCCIMLAALYGFAKRIEANQDTLDKKLGIGLLLSLAAFFVVAGPRGVQPHLERYAIWTIVPATLAVSRGVTWWLRPNFHYRNFALVGSLATAAALLISFERLYFGVFAQSGGDSHLAFRTADVDPKQQVLQTIVSQHRGNMPTTIVSRNWWTRLPLEYLSANEPSIRVVEALPATPNSELPKQIVFVELAGTDDETAVLKQLASTHIPFERSVYADRAGRPVVVVFQTSTKRNELLKNFALPQFDIGSN